MLAIALIVIGIVRILGSVLFFVWGALAGRILAALPGRRRERP